MASKSRSRTLTDHGEIRRWAEERGAKPSAVQRTHSDDDPGIIRLDFPGYSGEGSLEEIDWDEWFEEFENKNLALLVQDQTANGEQSNFNKLVSRESVSSSSGEASNSPRRSRSSSKKAGGHSRRESSSHSRESHASSAKKASSREHKPSQTKRSRKKAA